MYILNREEIILNKKDIETLLDYFYKRAGYISPEFDEALLELIKNLFKFNNGKDYEKD